MSATTGKIKGNWNELNRQYANLIDNYLTYVEGKEGELYGRLQQKLGKAKDEVKGIFEQHSNRAEREEERNK